MKWKVTCYFTSRNIDTYMLCWGLYCKTLSFIGFIAQNLIRCVLNGSRLIYHWVKYLHEFWLQSAVHSRYLMISFLQWNSEKMQLTKDTMGCHLWVHSVNKVLAFFLSYCVHYCGIFDQYIPRVYGSLIFEVQSSWSIIPTWAMEYSLQTMSILCLLMHWPLHHQLISSHSIDCWNRKFFFSKV